REFHDAGYSIEGEIVAGPRHRSRRQVLQRFLEQREDKGFGRYVSERKHDQGYLGVLDTADAVEESGLFQCITVRDPTGDILYRNELTDSGAMALPPGGARAAIIRARATQPSGRTVTQHIRFLKAVAESLRDRKWTPEIVGIARSLPYSGATRLDDQAPEVDPGPALDNVFDLASRTTRRANCAALSPDAVDSDFHGDYRLLAWQPMGTHPEWPRGEVSYRRMRPFLIGSAHAATALDAGKRQRRVA
ncbi:MAG: zeta toxin family protein, partial [Pseudonocardiaceae bacterium]